LYPSSGGGGGASHGTHSEPKKIEFWAANERAGRKLQAAKGSKTRRRAEKKRAATFKFFIEKGSGVETEGNQQSNSTGKRP